MTNEEFLETTKNYEGILTVDEICDIWRSISLKGFISKKFNQNPRLYWDESKVWSCKSPLGTIALIQSPEIVFITSNKTTLLGRICFSIRDNYGHSGTSNTKVSIVEIHGQSFATETGTILFEVTRNISYKAQNYINLPTPIIINASNTYQFCLEFTNQTGNPVSSLYSLGEVTSNNGLKITFQNVDGRQHMISHLDLIDY
ncbi:uncharacterized protein LOC116349653 [Contarinia nasturtii]|uniref:uncharacterized protein LOC116349653 n=1 Tax=Contarinia nasturtii TaxID=265458 RepID=UPI0012D4B8F5|nr:uncharacterized protein LOC116349653 [Contarinia nasturtii]